MFGHWYNSSLRRYIVLMGDLFSHIQVARVREDSGVKFIKVPITYASKEKFMMQINKLTAIQSTEDKAKIETILPRINLHLVDITYNAAYKTAQNNRVQVAYSKDPKRTVSQYNPTPIKMMFELGVYTRHQDDMFQIIEQILPYFQPHFNTTITELFDNEIKFDRDIRIVLQSISPDETIDGDANMRRRLEWSIVFEVNGWLYPPVTEIKGEIRTIYIDLFANSKELSAEGNFESVDSQVVPLNVEPQDWDGTSEQTYSHGLPIPTGDEPSAPRKNE